MGCALRLRKHRRLRGRLSGRARRLPRHQVRAGPPRKLRDVDGGRLRAGHRRDGVRERARRDGDHQRARSDGERLGGQLSGRRDRRHVRDQRAEPGVLHRDAQARIDPGELLEAGLPRDPDREPGRVDPARVPAGVHASHGTRVPRGADGRLGAADRPGGDPSARSLDPGGSHLGGPRRDPSSRRVASPGREPDPDRRRRAAPLGRSRRAGRALRPAGGSGQRGHPVEPLLDGVPQPPPPLPGTAHPAALLRVRPGAGGAPSGTPSRSPRPGWRTR